MIKTNKSYIVIRGVYPLSAREHCRRHNEEYHKGLPTANIVVDPIGKPGYVPKYMVICKVCGKVDEDKMPVRIS